MIKATRNSSAIAMAVIAPGERLSALLWLFGFEGFVSLVTFVGKIGRMSSGTSSTKRHSLMENCERS